MLILLACLLAGLPAERAHAQTAQSVDLDWALKPSAIGPGQSFRLLFKTTGTTQAASTSISHYNSFVQSRANSGHTAIRGFSGEFRALISTSAVHARDNTATTHTAMNRGVPIYWLGGAKVADDYADFYDGAWDSNVPRCQAAQTACGTISVWTGSNADGTSHSTQAAGADTVRVGRPGTTAQEISTENLGKNNNLNLLALSPVITVRDNPDKVTGVMVDQVTHNSIRVRWTKPAESSSRPITSFGIHTRTSDGAGGWITDPATGANAEGWIWRVSPGADKTEHTVTGLPSGVLQEVRVFARAEQMGDILYGESSSVQFTTPADTTAPTLDSATVNGATLTLTYDENLDESSMPAADAFTVSGMDRTVTDVAISGSAVTLTLSPAVTGGETVTVSYTAGTSPIQDSSDNAAVNLDNRDVTNNTPGLILSVSSLTVNEGASKTYTVRLTAKPSGNVTVTITSGDTAKVTVDTDTMTTGDQNTLTFTADNWMTSQTVSVSALETDTDAVITTLTHAITGASEYDSLADPTLAVTVHDLASGNAPEFEFPTGQTSYTFTLAENEDGSMTAVEVGTVSATDADGDDIAYSLVPASGGTPPPFEVDSSNGKVTYTGSGEDYESFQNPEAAFSFSVRATDDSAGTHMADATVTISVTDVGEAPGKPNPPTFGAATSTSIAVNWLAPANRNPMITDYNVRYRQRESGGWGGWIDHPHTGAARTTAIGSLQANTAYQVQVQAANSEGTGEWSDSGERTTAETTTVETPTANSAPAFGAASYTFYLPENADGTNAVVHVTTTATGDDWGGVYARDPDRDEITYFRVPLSGGPPFAVGFTNGLVTYRGSGEDYESFSNPQTAYSFVVRARDTGTGSDDVTVTIAVTDVEEPPGKPETPMFGATASTSIVVNWLPPANTGPAITDYDVRYREGDTGDWMDRPHTGTALTATVTGLTPETDYQAQVRATNPEGTGEWSDPGEAATPAADTQQDMPQPRGTTQPPPPSTPAGGGPGSPPTGETPGPGETDPDRRALNAFYDDTDGVNWTHMENWNTDEPLDRWYGVMMNYEDGRIMELDLSANGLSGDLTDALEALYDLGTLNDLETLDLSGNADLVGTLPAGLMDLPELRVVDTDGTGVCPPDDPEFQEWLYGIDDFRGGMCDDDEEEPGDGEEPVTGEGGGCSVASGGWAENASRSAALNLLLVAYLLLVVSRRAREI